MQSFESEKLRCAADISYALAAEITDLLKLREALQTAGRERKKLNRESAMVRQLSREMRARAMK